MPLLVFAEQWRLHPTFDGKIERIIDTPEYTYFLSYNQMYLPIVSSTSNIYMSLYRYDKDGDEIQWLNKQNILSESNLRIAKYNPDKHYLFIAYDNGNIDLLFDNGNVVNIPGLKLSNNSYSKNINAVNFSSENDEIYAVTDFGYIVVDDVKGEILRSRTYSKTLTSAARFHESVFLGCSDGLYIADVSSHDDFDKIKQLDNYENVRSIIPFADKLFVLYGEGYGASLPYLTYSDGVFKRNDWMVTNFTDVERRKDGLLICGPEDIWCIDTNLEMTSYHRDRGDVSRKISGWTGSEFWMDMEREGLCLKKASRDESGNVSWSVLKESVIPNACNAFKVTSMAYHPNYGMLMRNHGVDARLGNYDEQTHDLISSYRYFEWSPRSTTYLSPSEAFVQWNPRGIIIDPNDNNHVYSGSIKHGLMRLDLDEPSKSLRIAREGDRGNGKPGFVAVHPDFKGWSDASPFSEPAFDNYGNLWTSWYDYDLDKVKQNALEFWYWTPEDRAASKDAASFRPLKRIKIAGAPVGTSQMLIPLRSSSYRNILMYCPGTWEGLPVFIDHKGTLDNQNDDERVDIKEFIDQDGTNVNFAYVMSVYEDTSNGLVWLGLDKGVINFRPSEIMKTGGRVNRIKVSRNDGTNLADYLLDGVSVNCIVPDNSGRKWFGTGGGGIVVTSADGTEVLRTYTTDNSELPDNTVYSICYNPENNSMMISTDKGLAELFLSTSAGGDSDNKALIYPNPVRPDYFGYVTIEGLADNALVKIVDAGGNLIKEVGFAAGGEARWDVTNLNSKRVPGGVYYVLASGAPDGEGFSTVGKILVVN